MREIVADARDAFLDARGPRPRPEGDPESPLWDFLGKQWDHDRALFAAGFVAGRARSASDTSHGGATQVGDHNGLRS